MENYILENAINDVCGENCSNYLHNCKGGCCEGWDITEFHEDCPFKDEMRKIEEKCRSLLEIIDETAKSAKHSSVEIKDDDDWRGYPENESFNPFFVPYCQRKAL
ncbi:MAG: hypothetical protein IJP96_12375 [Synergistaceae bacterium]|nr:hypothetical protein [Synergistaceae bacterium]